MHGEVYGVQDGLFRKTLGRELGMDCLLNIWKSKWISRLSSFKVITPFNLNYSLLCVGDFIDRDKGDWRVDMLELLFLPVDVELIKCIPLSCSWPCDHIVWHYATHGEP